MKAVDRIGVICAIAVACLAGPGLAQAAGIVNGDFETGNMSGWPQIQSGSGGWFAYSGTTSPHSGHPIPAPPQGRYAAISDETGPSNHITYQDINLPPGSTRTLGLIAYYTSHAPIAVPTPDSLDPTIAANNQQYRIELIKPSAPLDTVNPSDILLTIFRTNNGDPVSLAPTPMSANLAPFAGQPVRLRFADVDNVFYMNSGTDAISLSPGPSNLFTLGKLRRDRRAGTALVPVKVPGPGTLTLFGNNVRRETATATAAGTTTIPMIARNAPLAKLRRSGRVKLKVTIVYTPTGGDPNTQTPLLVLKKSVG